MRPILKVTTDPIDPGLVIKSVRDPASGGIVTFVGTVRNSSGGTPVTGMELETAKDLAKADLVRIADEAMQKFEISRVSVVHRVGRLRVGDVIVAIAVSAPHRSDAFRACKFLIDELKKTTPIWKKEYSGKKSHWVQGEKRRG